MKKSVAVITLLAALLISDKASAKCFAIYGAATKNTQENVVNAFSYSQFLVPVTPELTKEECKNHARTGYWIEPVNAEPPPPPEVEAINNGVNSVVMAMAVCCFFMGFNSWETSAK